MEPMEVHTILVTFWVNVVHDDFIVDLFNVSNLGKWHRFK